MKKLLALFAFALVATNCGGGSDDNGGPTPDDKKVTFNLGQKQLSAASELDAQLTWKANDVMGIYCSRISATANYKATLNNASTFASTFAFNGTTEHTFYAYAPYNTSGSLSNKTPKITVALPAVQDIQKAVSDNAFVYSKTAAMPENGTTVNLTFSHLFAYAGFNVSSDLGAYKLKSVKLAAPTGAILAGSCTVDLQASQPATFASAGSSNSVSAATASPSLTMAAARSVYMVLNPQTASKDYTVTVDLENPADGSVARFRSTLVGKTYPAGTLTKADLATTSMTAVEDVVIDFGQASVMMWGGPVSVDHANLSVLLNDVRTPADSYGVRYRKSNSGDSWTPVTATDGRSDLGTLENEVAYDYEVWAIFKGQTYYSGVVKHFIAGVDTRDFYKRSLAMKFTGMWCHNCPNMSVIIQTASESWPNRLISMELHKDQGGVDPYELATMSQLTTRFNISAYPMTIVDVRALVENGQVAVKAPLLVNVGKESLANYKPACGITFNSSLSGRTLTVDTKIYVKESDDYLLSVVLAEDRTTTSQSGYTGTWEMHNIARVFMTNILGDAMPGVAGAIYEKQFTCTLPSDGVVANSKVLVYIQRKFSAAYPEKKGVTGVTYGSYGGYYVDNCSIAPLETQTLLEYEE